jgi:hypothetical protein
MYSTGKGRPVLDSKEGTRNPEGVHRFCHFKQILLESRQWN